MRTTAGKISSVEKPVVGWCEWVEVPAITSLPILAKMDTGARTSSLHALDIHPVLEEEGMFVKFKIHPRQGSRLPEFACLAPLLEQRIFKDSGGHRERRYVVSVMVQLAGKSWPIELSLTNRASMGFRLLLGRTALKGWLVSSAKSHILTRKHMD